MFLHTRGAGNSSLAVPSGYGDHEAAYGGAVTVSSINEINRSRVKPGLNRKANIALVVIIVTLCGACLFHAWHMLGHQVADSAKQEHDLHVVQEHQPEQLVIPELLESEHIFRASVKTCLPTLNKMCQTYVPKDTPRVAILAPPGDFGDWIFKWASKVIDTKLGSTAKMELQLISHVPPYGYGKTHGWTKLVRVLPRSLMLGAADAIRGSLMLGQTHRDLTVSDVKAALRMLLRYHCRVSHLAAHTAVLTLDMKSLASAPFVASEGLMRFLNISAVHHGEIEDLDEEEKEDSHDAGRYFTREQDIIAKTSRFESFAASLLTWIGQHDQLDVKKELEQVLQEELIISANFSKWPCESMWTAGEGSNGLELSQFGRRLAQSLAPDCDAPHTSCSVKKDRCEQAGDALCKK